MLDFLQDAVRAIWEILLAVPMPWRASLILCVAAVVGHQVGRRLLIFLLLPEFWVTNRLRRWGLRPLPGTYAFDSFVEWSIRILRTLAWISVLLIILGIVAWYAQPFLEGTAFARYVDKGVNWWYLLERAVLTGR